MVGSNLVWVTGCAQTPWASTTSTLDGSMFSGGTTKFRQFLNSSMVFTFCWTLSNFCMCIQAHFQPGQCEQLGPSLASSDVWRSLWRCFCSFLSTQISLVNFWLVCWSAACPNQDHNLRLAKPLVVSVCHQHHYCYWHCCWAWVFSMLHSKSVSQPPLAAKPLASTICPTLPELRHWSSLRWGAGVSPAKNTTDFYCS